MRRDQAKRPADGMWAGPEAQLPSSAMEMGTLSVGQVATGIDSALSTWFTGELWVHGEIDSLRRSSSGHVYFQLVERGPDRRPSAAISVALFDAARRYVNTQLRDAGGVRMVDGMRVRIRGRVEYYAAQGRVQLVMSGIDPSYTLALLVTERDRVIAALAQDDLLERNRELALPPLPLHVGLATSEGSAAMADFIDELRSSGFAWRVTFVPVPVQGRGADRIIERAISTLALAGTDVVALVRGGGSRLDLSTFDSEVVGRAIARMSVPVLTGIGHEVDSSVADVVAHTSFKTPTACASALVNRVRDHLDLAESLWADVVSHASASSRAGERELATHGAMLVAMTNARLDVATLGLAAGWHRARQGTVVAVDRRRRHLDRAYGRIEGGARHHVAAATGRLAAVSARLGPGSMAALDDAERWLAVGEAAARGADPGRLMRRGWSITRTSAGSVLRSAGDVKPGERLVTALVDGFIESNVAEIRTTRREDNSDDEQ